MDFKSALQQAFEALQQTKAYNNASQWAGQFGVQLPQRQLISPVPEVDTLNDPQKLWYVAHNQAMEETAKQPAASGIFPKKLEYPAWMANAPGGQPLPNAKPPYGKTAVLSATDFKGIPRLTPQTSMLLETPVATAAAQAYIQNIFDKYHPSTPDVPPGWKSPLADPAFVQQMAQLAYQHKLHPALQPLLAIAETQLLRPAASGTPKQNPYNVFGQGGTLFDYSQPEYGLDYALAKFAKNITDDWNLQGWKDFRQDPTLYNFIHAHNPADNPKRELNVMLNVAQQLGI